MVRATADHATTHRTALRHLLRHPPGLRAAASGGPILERLGGDAERPHLLDAEGLEDATVRPRPVPGAGAARYAACPTLAFPVILSLALLAILGFPAGARAQVDNVLLRVQPRVGDTLRTRFEQDIEMTGRTKIHGVDTTFRSYTSLLVLARVIVQASDSSGCTLKAITDSVSVLSVESQALTPNEAARRAMQGQEILLRLKPDGSASYVRPPSDLAPEVGALVASMPAVLSPRPVSPGATWESAMSVPVGSGEDPAHGARVRAQYRLDSLSADGARAYIGLLGIVTRDSGEAPLKAGSRVASRGTLAGGFILDRRRGWWADATFKITIGSTIVPAPAKGAPPGSAPPPVKVQTRITQHVHTEAPGPANAPPG